MSPSQGTPGGPNQSNPPPISQKKSNTKSEMVKRKKKHGLRSLCRIGKDVNQGVGLAEEMSRHKYLPKGEAAPCPGKMKVASVSRAKAVETKKICKVPNMKLGPEPIAAQGTTPPDPL